MQMAPRPIPVRALLVLTAAVLAAHVVLLQNAALGVGSDGLLATRAFTTRTLVINSPAAAPDSPPAPLPPRPRPRQLASASPTTGPAPAVATTTDAPTQAPAAAAAVPEPEPVADASTTARTPEPAASSAQAATAASGATSMDAAPAPAPARMTKDAELPVRAYAVPGSVRLKFNATARRSNLDYQARGELLWLQDGASYSARLEAGDFIVGSRVDTSAGRITADGLAPTRHSVKTKSELAAHFDRDKGRITFSANTPEAVLLPGAQDRLSIFMQLAAMVAGEPARYAAGTTIALQTVNQRSAEPWVFAVDEPETLHLPGGDLASLKLVRLPRKEFDQKIELWLAPALSYLPARIRVTEPNGNFLDLQWRSTSAP